jgi:hypothetical protein
MQRKQKAHHRTSAPPDHFARDTGAHESAMGLFPLGAWFFPGVLERY